MKVELWLVSSAQPLVFKNATTTYQKGDLFCVTVGEFSDRKNLVTYKYPFHNLFRIKESGK